MTERIMAETRCQIFQGRRGSSRSSLGKIAGRPPDSGDRPAAFCGGGKLLRLVLPDFCGEEHRGSRVGGVFQIKRSEEHTSELQSRLHLVCRLLLEKKKTLLD